jgi:beta-barrel assembly-enhancing protease
MNESAHRARPVLALMVALSLVAGVAEAQTKINPGWNLFSAQQDVEIGQQSAMEAERQMPILNDREIEQYVNSIGQRLAANAGGPQFQYRFKVVNASDINAFALPGGYIYLNRGIIENAKNEGELAGVLAHEIAHSALRHGTHQASKAYAANAGLQILGGLLGGKVGQNTAQILNTVGGVGLNALFLKFSRELETQADVRGAQILAASGYTPADMVSFFNTLAKVDTAKKTTWLSHHPAPPDRIARIEKERQLLREPATPTQNTAQLARAQTRLRGFGSAPTTAQIAEGGRTRSTSSANNPPMTSNSTVGRVEAPSSSFRTFRNRTSSFEIAYPSNWRVYDSGGFGVTIAPEGGVGTVGGKNEVVYGAMINHYDPFGNTSGTYLRDPRRSGGGDERPGRPGGSVQPAPESRPRLRAAAEARRQERAGGDAARRESEHPDQRAGHRRDARAAGRPHDVHGLRHARAGSAAVQRRPELDAEVDQRGRHEAHSLTRIFDRRAGRIACPPPAVIIRRLEDSHDV